ncbi:RNA polymerase sigma-70 factor, ECF subfamily [Chitinophaga costaii]|uniref:RNA polymerase sigma-70 factor, ECF subfamily n=1 Tax=Chitinophaga costaii TaxID=1335309 RepID=A0A1C4FA16_9BACT|nr:sigma-70 family RNA polymerase sigma factor [Chitinophaga costaii]PUZ20738.1 RNA polymerase subunit sigma-24 [Chitinophaga costaii]SCC52849.1 RNA polymerase sigma-70 factor, ECF subfamily [Chitinophaga costaii]
MYENLLSDAELLKAVQADDKAAFQLLYERYWKALYTKACQRVDTEEAKDLVQDVMITLWRRRREITVPADGDLARYLYTAIKYRVISHFAFHASEIKKAAFFDLLETPAASQFAETKELEARIEYAVSQLPSRMQQVFRMSREDDIAIKDIALQLAVSEQTVKNQLTEALKRLRTALSPQTPGEWGLILFYLFCHIHF